MALGTNPTGILFSILHYGNISDYVQITISMGDGWLLYNCDNILQDSASSNSAPAPKPSNPPGTLGTYRNYSCCCLRFFWTCEVIYHKFDQDQARKKVYSLSNQS